MAGARLAAAATLAIAAFAIGCGGDDSEEGRTLGQAGVREHLEAAGYVVTEEEPGQLPSLVSVDFATGPDSGFESAFSVSGNGLSPHDPTDISNTGFVLFYESADAVTEADDSLGDGEGQFAEGNVLFIYGNALDPPTAEFEQMMAAALGD